MAAKSMRIFARVALSTLLCIHSLQAFAAPQSSDTASSTNLTGPIKIGFLTSLSGVGANSGQAMVNGFKLYLDQNHDKIADREVQLIVADDEGSPAKGRTRLAKLMNGDKVDVLSGVFFASILYGVAPLVEKAQIPFVDCVSGADNVTQRQASKWIIRTSRSSSQPCHALGDFAAKKLGYKRIITFASDYPFGYESVGGFQKTFEQAGGQIVQKLWAPLDATDFSSLMKEMRKDANAVFFCTAGSSTAIVPKQYKEYGPHLPILGSETSFDEAILPTVGADLVGGVSCTPYTVTLKTPANQRFVELYRSKFGRDPSFYAECGYTSARWIDQAIDSLKGNVSDKEKVMLALRKVQLPDDPRGPLKLDRYGNVVENIYICKVEKAKSRIQNTVIHIYPEVSQFWHWQPEAYLKDPVYSKETPPCTHCHKG